jgi:hypothetical protein
MAILLGTEQEILCYSEWGLMLLVETNSWMKNVVFWDIQETHYVSVTESSQLMLCKIWGFHGGDYEECHLLGYKNPDRTSQETHYVSDTEHSQLMLCKIWGFHGSDYEECLLLGHKIPVRTSQKTHYFSATDSNRLMLCKIWGVHGGDYEEWRLLRCYAVWLLYEPTFWRNVAPRTRKTLAVTTNRRTLRTSTIVYYSRVEYSIVNYSIV